MGEYRQRETSSLPGRESERKWDWVKTAREGLKRRFHLEVQYAMSDVLADECNHSGVSPGIASHRLA